MPPEVAHDLAKSLGQSTTKWTSESAQRESGTSAGSRNRKCQRHSEQARRPLEISELQLHLARLQVQGNVELASTVVDDSCRGLCNGSSIRENNSVVLFALASGATTPQCHDPIDLVRDVDASCAQMHSYYHFTDMVLTRKHLFSRLPIPIKDRAVLYVRGGRVLET